MRLLRGHVFTLAEIIAMDDLPDNPCLMIVAPSGDFEPVQHSHINDMQLLTVPGIAESKWRYVETTREEIPVFHFATTHARHPASTYFDVTEETDEFYQGMWWITPKGFPREQ